LYGSLYQWFCSEARRPLEVHFVMTATAFAIPSPTVRTVANTEAEAVPRILIVDDEPLSRDLVTRILQSEGFQTAAAGDTGQALEALRTGGIDLILLDVVMPGCDGFEFCRAIKSDRAHGAIPVIFVSGLDEPLDRIRGLEAGGEDYIMKPFLAEELLARVRIHLRLRDALRCMIRQQEASLEELRDAQRSILVAPEDLPEASFAVCYRPLGAVGGDIYDVVRVGEGLYGYLVGDISGHGIGASFLTSAVKALLRQYSGPVYSAEDTLRRMNLVLKATLHDGHYLTASYARYCREKQTVTVVCAGHPAPIFVHHGGDADAFPIASEPLGLFDSITMTKRDVRVAPGDRYYLYTDGLIEDPALPGGGRKIGVERLCRACERWRGLPLAEAVETIADAAGPVHGAAGDDVLLLGVEVPA
jgi:phosphoserine phosphatase RsbU/P